MSQTNEGSGAVSGLLYELWKSKGRPERIGYAATGGAVDAGARFVAVSSTCCAGGALGLREDGGRLYGRWCGVEDVPYVAAHTTGGQQVGGREVGAFGFVFVTTQAPWVILPEYITNPFSVPAALNLAWTDQLGNPGSYSHVFSARQRLSMYAEILGPFFGGVSDGSRAKHLQGTASWTEPISYAPVLAVPATDLALLSAKVVEVNLGAQGVPWLTAGVWSKAGEWVRRKSWSDASRMIRHESGPGPARAVAVFKSSTVTTARPVQTAEFGAAEFAAQDWALKYPPAAGDLDLTEAVISVDATRWALWKVVGKKSAPNQTDLTDPATQMIPKNGEGFLYLKNGVPTLVQAKDEYGNPWAP